MTMNERRWSWKCGGMVLLMLLVVACSGGSAPKGELQTLQGPLVVEEIEQVDRFPPECGTASAICVMPNAGQELVVFWLQWADAEGSGLPAEPQDRVNGFSEESRAAYLTTADGTRLEWVGSGLESGRLFLLFSVPAGSEDLTLHWPQLPASPPTPVAAPTEPQAAPEGTLGTPTAGAEWAVVLDDRFDSNAYGWPEGPLENAWLSSQWTIAGGRYRWEATALQPFHWYANPAMEPIADLSLAADVQQVSGPPDAGYGVVVRASPGSLYFFAINNNGQYAFLRLSGEEWRQILPWTPSEAIRPGQVNRLAVVAEGDHFAFTINGSPVDEADDGTIGQGRAGVSMNLYHAGDQAILEVDNFSMRVPSTE
jgi:hypothetical protein